MAILQRFCSGKYNRIKHLGKIFPKKGHERKRQEFELKKQNNIFVNITQKVFTLTSMGTSSSKGKKVAIEYHLLVQAFQGKY